MPVSARLAVWAGAWLRGEVSSDDVLDALDRSGERHVVVGLTVALAEVGAVGTFDPKVRPALDASGHLDRTVASAEPLGAVLIAWKAVASEISLVLPSAGDVRGLPVGSAFANAATAAGEGVVGGPIGLVPSRSMATASSARVTVTWTAFAVDAARPDPLQLSEASRELAIAMRETASLFAAADLTGSRVDVGDALARARRAGEHLDLPPGYPPQAVALAAQTERLAAVLAIAEADVHGGAVDRAGMSQRDHALRTLRGTVRRARQAAYNAYREPA